MVPEAILKNEFIEKARVMILEAGMREKDLRIIILGLLLQLSRPVSHNDLMSEEALEGADRVSVYRNLSALCEAELAHSVQGMDGTWRFCAQNSNGKRRPGGHAHFMCTECKKMICLLDHPLPRIDVPEGTKVEGKQLVVYGICPDCASLR